MTITREIGKSRFPCKCPDERAVKTRIRVSAEKVMVGAWPIVPAIRVIAPSAKPTHVLTVAFSCNLGGIRRQVNTQLMSAAKLRICQGAATDADIQ
jgi:hypothetical protein